MNMAFLELDQYNPTKIRQYKKVRWFGDISKIVCIFVWSDGLWYLCCLQLTNTGIINIDDEPNNMTLAEAKEAYTKGLPIR